MYCFSGVSQILVSSTILFFGLYFTIPAMIHHLNKYLVTLMNDNPDYLATTCELAMSRGYHCETHSVTTQDGYILDIQRVLSPNRKSRSPKKVALLMHGFQCDSSIWVQNQPNQSLAYILADSDIDVWLGNLRGSFYGEKHITHNSAVDSKFWEFSFQQMAQYDLPDMVDYISRITSSEKIYYIGHSMGTLIAFLQMSEDKSLANKIEYAFMLAPVHTLTDMKSPFKYFLRTVYNIGHYLPLPSGRFGVRPPLDFLIWASHYPLPSRFIIEGVWLCFSGTSEHALNRNETNVISYFTHGLAGTSVQNVRHFAQIYTEQTLSKFDFKDSRVNKLHYNRTDSPKYEVERVNDPEKVRTKFVMFWGDRDWLVSEWDRKKLQEKLKHVTVYSKVCENFSHLDFIWGLRASDCAYLKIREFINQHQKITANIKHTI